MLLICVTAITDFVWLNCEDKFIFRRILQIAKWQHIPFEYFQIILHNCVWVIQRYWNIDAVATDVFDYPRHIMIPVLALCLDASSVVFLILS
jgi:hypothetical protein